jgi:hypothetical protein
LVLAINRTLPDLARNSLVVDYPAAIGVVRYGCCFSPSKSVLSTRTECEFVDLMGKGGSLDSLQS